VIVSDGWDTGDLEVLEHAMRGLRARAGRVIWLNPLLGSPGYEPVTQGMSTALPYVDVFASAHNLHGLRVLERYLQNPRASRLRNSGPRSARTAVVRPRGDTRCESFAISSSSLRLCAGWVSVRPWRRSPK